MDGDYTHVAGHETRHHCPKRSTATAVTAVVLIIVPSVTIIVVVPVPITITIPRFTTIPVVLITAIIRSFLVNAPHSWTAIGALRAGIELFLNFCHSHTIINLRITVLPLGNQSLQIERVRETKGLDLL